MAYDPVRESAEQNIGDMQEHREDHHHQPVTLQGTAVIQRVTLPIFPIPSSDQPQESASDALNGMGTQKQSESLNTSLNSPSSGTADHEGEKTDVDQKAVANAGENGHDDDDGDESNDSEL